MVAILAAYGAYLQLMPAQVDLPAHLTVPPPNTTTMRICEAYKHLFRLNEVFFKHPPDLYTLLDVSPSASDGPIVAALNHKTEAQYRALEREHGYGRDAARAHVTAYNRVGLVLLVEENRRVYDRKIKGRGNIKLELMGICEDEFRE
ncbi:hypothetical protein ACHAP7_009715 [Fusarium lateritium]